ncbi:uncharacterized protein K02A2.6-like [Galendromus occidentalis]|uniref:Uncharacterized protein K02A2.6-like n=1 Tax=Galendromus occidentalis TaxID=34638 RepID=A0AAJ7L543_9ACAR|nr:uncharacterized protein K02A2.6-like [Galendromus occidentalis]
MPRTQPGLSVQKACLSKADPDQMNSIVFSTLCSENEAFPDGRPIEVKGFFIATLATIPGSGKKKSTRVEDRIVVFATETGDLLGGNVPYALDLLSTSPSVELAQVNLNTEGLKSKFPKLFETSLGLCTKTEVELLLKPDASPVCLPARPLVMPVRELVDQELDRLVNNGTLCRVDSSDWAAPIVVVRKANGQIRMCADYSTGLNEALQDVDYPLPNMEEIMAKFSGNTVFTQLDLADAYLQLPLCTASRVLTTINTHRGLFQYHRLVFGLKTAPAIFQRTIEQTLAGLDGVLVYLDDIVREFQGNLKKARDGREDGDRKIARTHRQTSNMRKS